jgi:hypothetical protein
MEPVSTLSVKELMANQDDSDRRSDYSLDQSVTPPPAYSRNNGVSPNTKLIMATAVVVSIILGACIVAGSYIARQSTCDCSSESSGVQKAAGVAAFAERLTSGEDESSATTIAKLQETTAATTTPKDQEGDETEVKEKTKKGKKNKRRNKNKRNKNKDRSKELERNASPVIFQLDNLARTILDHEERALVNCVIEKKRPSLFAPFGDDDQELLKVFCHGGQDQPFGPMGPRDGPPNRPPFLYPGAPLSPANLLSQALFPLLAPEPVMPRRVQMNRQQNMPMFSPKLKDLFPISSQSSVVVVPEGGRSGRKMPMEIKSTIMSVLEPFEFIWSSDDAPSPPLGPRNNGPGNFHPKRIPLHHPLVSTEPSRNRESPELPTPFEIEDDEPLQLINHPGSQQEEQGPHMIHRQFPRPPFLRMLQDIKPPPPPPHFNPHHQGPPNPRFRQLENPVRSQHEHEEEEDEVHFVHHVRGNMQDDDEDEDDDFKPFRPISDIMQPPSMQQRDNSEWTGPNGEESHIQPHFIQPRSLRRREPHF